MVVVVVAVIGGSSGPWEETSFSIKVGVLRILMSKLGSIRFPWLLDIAVVKALYAAFITSGSMPGGAIPLDMWFVVVGGGGGGIDDVAGDVSSSSIGVMGMRGVWWSLLYGELSVWIGDAGLKKKWILVREWSCKNNESRGGVCVTYFGGIADGRG